MGFRHAKRRCCAHLEGIAAIKVPWSALGLFSSSRLSSSRVGGVTPRVMGSACSSLDDGSGRPLEARRGSRSQHRSLPRGPPSRKSLAKSQRSGRRSQRSAPVAQEEDFSALPSPPARVHGVTAGASGAFAKSPQQHDRPVVTAVANAAALEKFAAPTRSSDNFVGASSGAAAVAESDDLTGDLASLAATGPSVACRIGGGRAATNISAVLQADDADGRRSAFSDATTTGGGGSRRTSLASLAATPNPLRAQ